MPRTRLTAILYLVLVFASGILVGVASNRLYTVKASVRSATAPWTMEELRKSYTAQMKQRVGVSDDQAAAVAKILDSTKKKFDEIRRQERPLRDRIQQEQVDEIRALLTDTQKTAFDAWRAERQRAQQLLKQNRARAATGSTENGAAK
jgi:hypothetical protein